MSTLTGGRGADPANPDPYRQGDDREGFSPPGLTQMTESDLALYRQLQAIEGAISNLSDVMRAAERRAVERQLTQVEIPSGLAGGQLAAIVGGVAGAKIAVVNYVISTRTGGGTIWQWLGGKFRSTASQISGKNLGTLGFTTTAEQAVIPVIGSVDSPVLITDIGQDLVLFCQLGTVDGGHLVYYTIESGP